MDEKTARLTWQLSANDDGVTLILSSEKDHAPARGEGRIMARSGHMIDVQAYIYDKDIYKGERWGGWSTVILTAYPDDIFRIVWSGSKSSGAPDTFVFIDEKCQAIMVDTPYVEEILDSLYDHPPFHLIEKDGKRVANEHEWVTIG